MNNKLKNLKEENEELTSKLASKEKQVLDAKNKIESLQREIAKYKEFEGMYYTVVNSTTWRMTRPVRLVLDKTKELLAKNETTWLMYKGLRYFKNYGFKNTIKKIKAYKENKDRKNTISYDVSNFEHINLKDIPVLTKCNKKIAVHIHLYYVDLLEEFAKFLENIPYKFDAFISTKEIKDIVLIQDRLKQVKNIGYVDVRQTINRGRDIAPFYVQFREEILKYDYVLHAHSKKSLFTGKEQYGWRQYSLDCLLGSKELVSKIFALFEDNRLNKFGLFYPEIFGDMHLMANSWLQNAHHGRNLLESMNMRFENGFINYPVGSFFWAKVEALKPIFDLKLQYEDFPEEAGQTDGTIAHALERVISFVVKERGYRSAIYDIRNDVAFIDKSIKAYQEYFALNKEKMLDCLTKYDVITFDIFDTLITRKILRPDDLFHIMTEKIKAEYGLNLDYLFIRKQAEYLATVERGAYCNIHDIYEKMGQVIELSQEVIANFKEMEINLELEICMAREDVLWVFDNLKKAGKKIILLSDMYLTSDIIEAMLEKCGYVGYDDIVVSCEVGLRKDQGTMWNWFFNEYCSFRTIHIGDNVHSDIQLVVDRRKDTFYVMNPYDSFKLSNLYGCLNKYVEKNIDNSLMLGLLINGNLFNSPFAQNYEAMPYIDSNKKFGKVTFGPVLTNFINFLSECQNGENLWFLAREGFLLKSLYDEWCVRKNIDNRSCYFFASRRAASVASINNVNDVKEILSQFYDGGVKNLLKSRLGLDISCEDDFQIRMPEDIDRVMGIVNKYEDIVLDSALKEKTTYLKYINGLQCDGAVSVVDIGYSGTIQYYLTKLVNKKINGYYMITSNNRKPERLGCKCSCIYSQENNIFKQQLFFEAILKAPYGQLIQFKESYDGVEPVFKDDSEINEVVEEIQNGIVAFEKEFIDITNNIGLEIKIDDELAEDICISILSKQYTCNGSVMNDLFVQDDYCSNSNLIFDEKNGAWHKCKQL